MHKTYPTIAALALCTATLLLAGCGSDDKTEAEKDFPSDKEKIAEIKAKVKKVDPICPQVAVVRSLDTLVDYAREKPDPKQLVVAGKLTGIDGHCSYADDGIDVRYDLSMVAKRGPAMGSRHTNLPIFIAVVDPSGKILNKNQITASIDFSSEETTANHSEALHVFIPLDKNKQPSGPAYQVLTGFQL